MLLLDVKNRRWSREMCDVCGISEQMLPKLHESYEVVGMWNLPQSKRSPLRPKSLPMKPPRTIRTRGFGSGSASAVQSLLPQLWCSS